MRMHRLTRRAAAAVSTLALAAGLTLAAAPAGAANTGIVHYTNAFAGVSLVNNGATIFNGAWHQDILPSEPSTAPPAVAYGLIMANNVSTGGPAQSEAFVLNSTQANSCPPAAGAPSPIVEGVWTLEASFALGTTISLPSQPVLPYTYLSPLSFEGGPVCIYGAGSYFTYMYESHKYHQVDFSGGPNSRNWNVLRTINGMPGVFRTVGAGISTCSNGTSPCTGINGAANLVTGNDFGPAGIGVFVNGKGNSVFGQGVNVFRLNYDNWQGTLSGGLPTAINPPTLTESPATLAGPYGPMSILVP